MKPCLSMPTTEHPKRLRRSSSAIVLPWQSARSGSVQSIMWRSQSGWRPSHGAVVDVIFVSETFSMFWISTSSALCQ